MAIPSTGKKGTFGPISSHLQWDLLSLLWVDTEAKILSHQQGRCWGSILSFLSSCIHIQWYYSAYFQQPKSWTKITTTMGQVGDLLKSHIDFILFFRNCIYHLSIYIRFWSNLFPISSIKITAYFYHQFVYKLQQPFHRSPSPFTAKDLSWGVEPDWRKLLRMFLTPLPSIANTSSAQSCT